MTTWTPKTQQAETWTTEPPQTLHVFDPNVFAPNPVFDTYTAGLWTGKTEQAEVWTAA